MTYIHTLGCCDNVPPQHDIGKPFSLDEVMKWDANCFKS